MPEGGSLSFNTESRDETVFIKISDSGEGMHENVKKMIFDPYYTTKKVVGSGLGMSMSYGIIKRHGGKIEVESEIGKGSTFTLQFPATTKTVNPTETLGQETNEKNLHILVVDDEEAIRNILVRFLSRKGHKIKTVDNSADAIELVKNEVFDLALCDPNMPNAYGCDVVRELHNLEKTPKIGIITSGEEELKPMERESMTADFIVRKPFQLSELARNINEIFENDI